MRDRNSDSPPSNKRLERRFDQEIAQASIPLSKRAGYIAESTRKVPYTKKKRRERPWIRVGKATTTTTTTT